MRKIFTALLLAVMLACTVWAFRPELLPWENITTQVDAFAAAQQIQSGMEAQPPQTTFRFRDERVRQGDLFRSLEALWPYAFSLSTTAQSNGLLTVEVQVENEAAQRQAALLARGVAEQRITAEMPLEARLRVLHDYVVRSCVYDTATAQHESLREGSGADAPFTAAGALVDGRAVCAGYSRAFMQLCSAAGIDALYISDETMNHGWNVVRVYDQILYIDTTFDDPLPDRGDEVLADYFLLPADALAKTHTWDRAFYDPLVARALPPSLGDAQRLFDAGLLPAPPRAAEIHLPMAEPTRAFLAQSTGLTFAADETLGQAATRAWAAQKNSRKI